MTSARIYACCALVAFLACSPGADRPNVVLITVDTLRADYLSTYGFSLQTSPNIDAFAEQAVLFERAIAAASTTAPSHASIMTSLWVREHSVGYGNGATKLVDADTLALRFQRAGYATGAFVGNVLLSKQLGLDRGFDVYDDELPTAEVHRRFVFERIAADTYARVEAWLDATPGPFFLWVHLQDPHGPYLPPLKYVGRFELPGGPSEPVVPLLKTNYGRGGVPTYQLLPGAKRASEYRARYADEIFYADEWIGQLFRRLDAQSNEKRPIILLTADHGEYLGEDNTYFQHGLTTLPPEAQVPFILRAPMVAPERRSDLVSHVDIMPTLLELAGLEPLEDASGLALGPYLRDKRALPARDVFCDLGIEVSAYRGDHFVRIYPAKDPWNRNVSQPPNRHWSRHVLRPGTTGPGEEVGMARRGEILRYLDSARPMVFARPPKPGELERLRALGYVD